MYFLFRFSTFQRTLKRSYSNTSKPPWNVLFFGSDNFSISSLRALYNEFKHGQLIQNLDVCTSIKTKSNLVEKFANDHKLKIYPWPIKTFKQSYDVGVVVSFGHLIPESIINQFKFGILNIHPSLLPRWRGAAPTVHAIASGDKITGVSIIRIKPKVFDIGDIIEQQTVQIDDTINVAELNEKLGNLGADRLIHTLSNLETCLSKAVPQPKEGVKLAPKINPEFAHINWNQKSAKDVYNLERSLIGFLMPFTNWNGKPIKLQGIKEAKCDTSFQDNKPGFIFYDRKNKVLKILCANKTCVSVSRVKLWKKEIMSATDFNNGFLKKESIDRRYFK